MAWTDICTEAQVRYYLHLLSYQGVDLSADDISFVEKQTRGWVGQRINILTAGGIPLQPGAPVEPPARRTAVVRFENPPVPEPKATKRRVRRVQKVYISGVLVTRKYVVHAIACPVCGAPQGESCRSSNGPIGTLHAERRSTVLGAAYQSGIDVMAGSN